jgi:hypothetical protein
LALYAQAKLASFLITKSTSSRLILSLVPLSVILEAFSLPETENIDIVSLSAQMAQNRFNK